MGIRNWGVQAARIESANPGLNTRYPRLANDPVADPEVRMARYRGGAVAALMAAAAVGGGSLAGEKALLELTGRHRESAPGGSYRTREKPLRWNAAETAVIVCDMWDRHWCRAASA